METLNVGGSFTTTEVIAGNNEDVVVTVTEIPGLQPVFTQIAVERETWNLNPEAAQTAIEDFISDKVFVQLSLN